MSFANEWLRYLEGMKGDWINYIIIRGNRTGNMPHTEISIDKEGGEVKQTCSHRRGMKIPDKIGIKPIETKSVEIDIPGGFTFYISKDRKMRIKYADFSGECLSAEKERTWKREAENRGYEVVEFIKTDV